MRPVDLVVIFGITLQDSTQMSLAKDDEVIVGSIRSAVQRSYSEWCIAGAGKRVRKLSEAGSKTDIRLAKMSCLLHPQKRTCAVQLAMSALGQ
jgi:hypothetical protein